MISAGNDIVALSRINKKRTNEPRFYSKILSLTEQVLYHQSQFPGLPFEYYVWLLWSVKESAYKFLKRNEPGLVFSPTKIIVDQIQMAHCLLNISTEDIQQFKGLVKIGPATLYFNSKISADWIASVVNQQEYIGHVCWDIKRIDDQSHISQSKAAKQFLVNKLSTLYSGTFKIEKHPVGYPEIFRNNNRVNIAASLAHDGFFIAYSFNLTMSSHSAYLFRSSTGNPYFYHHLFNHLIPFN